MSEISVVDARGLYTNFLIAKFVQKPKVMAFLRSFFPSVEYATKLISIEVMRGTERVAVDVIRGTGGNRNSVSRSTGKNFLPPYWDEYFDATEIDLYELIVGGAGSVDSAVFAQFVDNLAAETELIAAKIERALELACSQVLETGIIQLNAGTNIDFKRKALSLVDLGAGNYWTTGTVDPHDTMAVGQQFLRENGKYQGGIVNVIMGKLAFSAMMKNAEFKSQNDLQSIKRDSITTPQRGANGGTLHGELSVGETTARIWTYGELYEDSAGTKIPYINPKKIIMLPEVPDFKMAFAAVPQIIGGKQVTKKGSFYIQESMDEEESTHKIRVKSAAVPIPVAVDQIWTAQVIA